MLRFVCAERPAGTGAEETAAGRTRSHSGELEGGFQPPTAPRQR